MTSVELVVFGVKYWYGGIVQNKKNRLKKLTCSEAGFCCVTLVGLEL